MLVGLCLISCEKDGDDGGSSGTVSVSAIKGSKHGTKVTYKISVTYSGNDAKYCGINYGKTSGMSDTKTHTGSGSYTFSVTFYTGSKYYFQGYVKTTGGKTIKSSKKSVRVS